jgi:hypothetical protein
MSDIDRTSHDAPSDRDRSFTGEFVSFYDETFQLVNCSAASEETYKADVETHPTIWRAYPEHPNGSARCSRLLWN